MSVTSMNRRALLAAGAAATFVAASGPALAQASPDRAAVLDAMKRAARFMSEEAAVDGGYVWQYLPDFSRRWGELEASPTMIWVQPPGTATVGHLFLDAYHATGDVFYYEAAKKAADALIKGQHPAGARTIEPQAFVTHATGTNIKSMLGFYRLTGDRKYLARLPEAMDWLDQVATKPPLNTAGRTHSTFVLEGANTPVYIHRRGSNIANGQYYADDNPTNLIVHYGSFRNVDTPALRAEYARLSALSVEEATQGSPLKARPGSLNLPKYFTLQDVDVWDMSSDARRLSRPHANRAAEVMAGLNARGYWSTPLTTTSNPYKGPSPRTVTGGEYQMTRVGDLWDTSPYQTDFPVEGVSTSVFIRNMGDLIEALGV